MEPGLLITEGLDYAVTTVSSSHFDIDAIRFVTVVFSSLYSDVEEWFTPPNFYGEAARLSLLESIGQAELDKEECCWELID